MENMLDALNEKIDLKVTVLNQEMKKNNVSLVKFASKEKEKQVSAEDRVFDYDDDKWFWNLYRNGAGSKGGQSVYFL